MKILPAEALRRPSPVSTPASPARPPPSAPASEPGSFAQVLGRVGRRIDEGERALDRASRPSASSDPAELLALQAQVYRYVEAVDLATKLVDRVTSAVKTTLQSQ